MLVIIHAESSCPYLYGLLWLMVRNTAPALFLALVHHHSIHNHRPMASGKKKTRSTNRGWWWTEFTEHPGYESSEPISMVQQKAKVICTRQLEHYVAAERARDEIEVQFGSRDHVRDEQAI